MPSEVAKRLRDRRLSVWEEAKGIAEKAAEENRSLSEEEQGRWDALQEEMQKLDTRIRAVLDTEKRAKDADDAFDALSGKKPAAGTAAATAATTASGSSSGRDGERQIGALALRRFLRVGHLDGERRHGRRGRRSSADGTGRGVERQTRRQRAAGDRPGVGCDATGGGEGSAVSRPDLSVGQRAARDIERRYRLDHQIHGTGVRAGGALAGERIRVGSDRGRGHDLTATRGRGVAAPVVRGHAGGRVHGKPAQGARLTQVDRARGELQHRRPGGQR